MMAMAKADAQEEKEGPAPPRRAGFHARAGNVGCAHGPSRLWQELFPAML